jgi:hypothetical protein
MRFTTYLMLAVALLMAGIVLFQACVLISRRWAGHLPVYPVSWSPEQVLAWERWRLVLGLLVIASWLWGGAAFCVGLLLGPAVALNFLWLTMLGGMLVLTSGWLSVVFPTSDLSKLSPKQLKKNFTFQLEPGMWLSVAILPTSDLSKLTPKQFTRYKMFALGLVIVVFVLPIGIVGDSYFAPPWGSNVSVRGP